MNNNSDANNQSDEKYAQLFQRTSVMLSISTINEGRFIEVNEAFLTTLGFSRDETIGKTSRELGLFVDPDDRNQLRQAIEKKAPLQNIEIQIRDKNKQTHDCLFSVTPATINNEECWLMSATDISTIKQANLALQKLAGRYEHIVENQSELVCRYRPNGKLSFVNESYAHYFGKRREELVETNFIPHIPEPDMTQASKHLSGITRENPEAIFEHRVIMPGGEVRYQRWSHRGIYAADGSLIEYQAVGRDITNFKQAEQAIIESSENKFKTIFEHATDGILIADLETMKFAMANNEICRMLGYSREEIRNLKVADIHPQQDLPHVCEIFARQAKGEISLAKDMPIMRKDGSIFYADINATLIMIAGKQYLAGFFQDITEHKQAEAELFLAHSQLKNLIDAASQVSIIATDYSGTILTFNSGAERMLGYSAQELIGKQTPLIIHLASEIQDRSQKLTKELGYPVEGFEVFVAYAKQGKFDEREWTYVKKDGKHITVDLIVTAIKDEHDKTVGFLGIATDITDRKLTLQAQAASTAMSQFVANISHEIRTPLNGIIGICELLMETRMSKEQLEYAQIIDCCAETLLKVINDTLDFSKIEAGKMELENIDFNLENILEDIVGMLAANAAKKNLELINFINPEVPLYLRGDPSRLRQIFLNLVGNAIKFTFKGEITIDVELVEENNCQVVLRFAVHDTGIGIPDDKINTIFDAFIQADTSLARRFGGTGLGLTITRGLVKQMGGTIGVTSQHDNGSTFWFILPFTRQPHAVQSFAPQNYLGATNILVVDDNSSNCQMIARHLQSWRISADTAANGPAALVKMLEAAKIQRPFTAVIIDLQMPGMDGVALARAIKADRTLRKTTLLLMKSMDLLPKIYLPKQHLFDGIIIKPIRYTHLFYSLLMALKGKKLNAMEKKWISEFQKHEQYQSGNRLHILVVEDNIANQQVSLSILTKMGHAANAVANGQEALTALKTILYDLVLMDIQMPGMDGLEATAIIRNPKSQVHDHDIPILALTAHATQADREKCLAAGMNGYITKPVSIKAIADAIAKIYSSESISASKDKPVPANEPAAVFDSTAFSKRLSGKTAPMIKIIDITLDELPKLMRQFKQAIKKRQQENAGRLAHNIRGSAANVSGNQFLAVAVKLETACNAGDWRESENLLPELSRQLAILEKAMRKYQDTLG